MLFNNIIMMEIRLLGNNMNHRLVNFKFKLFFHSSFIFMVAIYRLCRPRATVGPCSQHAVMQYKQATLDFTSGVVPLRSLNHAWWLFICCGLCYSFHSLKGTCDSENSGIRVSVQTSDKLGRICKLKFIKQWQFQYYNMTVNHG